MTDQQFRARVRYVIGPDGSPLTVADLPPPETKRWVIRRKAEVVAAVRGGLISLEEACERYTLTVDEFLSWQRSIEKHGLPPRVDLELDEARDLTGRLFLAYRGQRQEIGAFLGAEDRRSLAQALRRAIRST